MGVTLVNVKNEELCVSKNITGWLLYLSLAEYGGWKPIGTKLEHENDWCGDYTVNDGQTVIEEEAQNIAHALQKAADELTICRDDDGNKAIRDFYRAIDKFFDAYDEGRIGRRALRNFIEANMSLLDPRFDDRLKEMIDFCGAGAFRIF